jgi:predicted RNA binding protein YcfA (HicA-like mRNA interferase family)
MPKLPVLTSKILLKVLQKNGFKIDHTTGSHYILYRTEDKRRVVVPFHCKDLPKGTAHSILRAANLSEKDINK